MEELIELTYVSYNDDDDFIDEGVAKIWLDPSVVVVIIAEAEDRPTELVLQSGVSIFIQERAASVVPVINRIRKRSREKWWLKN